MKVTIENVRIEENGEEILHLGNVGFIIKSKGLFETIANTIGETHIQLPVLTNRDTKTEDITKEISKKENDVSHDKAVLSLLLKKSGISNEIIEKIIDDNYMR